jgi:hypothetical protein
MDTYAGPPSHVRTLSLSLCLCVGTGSVDVGASAIPTLLKMTRVMQAMRTEWSQQGELPVRTATLSLHICVSLCVSAWPWLFAWEAWRGCAPRPLSW